MLHTKASSLGCVLHLDFIIGIKTCPQLGELQHIIAFDPLVIFGIRKSERHNAEAHQVLPMDARKADRDDKAQSQITRRQRRMLALEPCP